MNRSKQPLPLLRRRKLPPPRQLTGRERRWINPNKGLFKILERNIDIGVSRFVYPHMARFWSPYGWVLENRFGIAETTLSPAAWPRDLKRLRVLLLSDIHTGTFLNPALLARIVNSLMALKPDLVAIAGDIVTGDASELKPFLETLAPLARAPLGAWFCFGNHDYFGGDPNQISADLASVGVTTLKNDSTVVNHSNSSFVIAGIDDRILGKPDWERLLFRHGVPHLLLAHNPDSFYEACARGVPLTLSGHTHGGQIRFPNRSPIIRQSKYCLDEGAYSFQSSLLVVSRGLGSVGIPWRWGADPEAVLVEILPPRKQVQV
jgi:predicted MPP superfamily phosphohydrolase